MPTSRRSAITTVALCSVLGAVGACSSDSPPLDQRDAETSDVFVDRPSSNDAVASDATDVSSNDAVASDATDVSSIDATSLDAPRMDASPDTVSGDARVDAPLSDRTSNDVSSTDSASGDSAVADAPPTDSTATDAPSGDGGNDPRCPPSYGTASGQQCASASPTCVYAEGTCGCLPGCGALPPPDAGSRWFCGMRGAGCPIQKPTVGSPCSMDAQSCNYGTCCMDLMICENAAWKSGGFLCPP